MIEFSQSESYLVTNRLLSNKKLDEQKIILIPPPPSDPEAWLKHLRQTHGNSMPRPPKDKSVDREYYDAARGVAAELGALQIVPVRRSVGLEDAHSAARCVAATSVRACSDDRFFRTCYFHGCQRHWRII